MDPASIIGVVGSGVNVIEGLARTIDRITILKTHWKIADLSINLILGQLSTIKTALVKLERLSNGHAVHNGLASLAGDIRLTVAGCHDLLSLIDDKLVSLESNSDGSLTTKSKARLLWDKTETDLYQSFLDRQINALNLYMTVAQQDQQNTPPTSPNSEASGVLKSARDITESLFAIKGTPAQSIRTSFCAETASDTASNISRQFDFDSEILNSSPYRRATSHNLRSLIFARRTKRGGQVIAPSDSISRKDQPRPLSAEWKHPGVPPALRGIFTAKNTVVVRAPVNLEAGVSPSVIHSFASQSTAHALYRISVYGLSQSLPLTLRICASLPSTRAVGDQLVCSSIIRHYLIAVAFCLSRIDMSKSTSVVHSIAARLVSQLRVSGSFDDTTRKAFIDDVNALWNDENFRTAVLSQGHKSRREALLHIIRETARLKRKDYVPTQKDFDCVKHVSAADLCSFVEKGASSFSTTFSSIRNPTMLQDLPKQPPTTHVVLALDISFLLVYFEEQQGSLHWSSDNEMEALVDSVRGEVSMLISQSEQLKLLRAITQSAHKRLIAVFNKFRRLQKVLGSKFGIVLSGAGHGSYPDLAKELSEFIIDEFRRQSCGSFETIFTDLDQREASVGKQLRKQIQASGHAADGESLDPSLVGRANLSINGLSGLASSIENVHPAKAPESLGSASTAPSTVYRDGSGSGASTPVRLASIQRIDTDVTLPEPLSRKSSSPDADTRAEVAVCRPGEVG